MKPSTQADLDAAAVARSLAILRTAREEINGWCGITVDRDTRGALVDVCDALHDLEVNLKGSVE